MKMHLSQRPARTGFTLIEILVVIAIIAILISLLMSAVFKAWSSGARVACQTEIRELEIAFADAMAHWKVKYLPSKLTLRENGIYPKGDKTAEALQMIFGKNILGHGVDWNGNGTMDGPATLFGEELLVFYLGGIPGNAGGNPTVLGFSSDPSDPSNSQKYTDSSSNNRVWLKPRILPFYKNFNSSRLVPSPVAQGFLRYLHPFQPTPLNPPMPYVYFSTSGGPNNYSQGDSNLGVAPYYQGSMNSAQYFNPNSFQIISAGQDNEFGPGGQINGANGVLAGPGHDDLANFSKSVLGAPIN